MSDKAKLIDRAKNLAILLLSLSAILLLLRITIRDGQTTIREPGTTPPVSYGGAASPVFLLLTGDGSHYAFKYDNEGKQRLSAQFSAYLGEALGSAEKFTELSTEDFQTALKDVGVFFDYLYPQPLEIIAAGLGTEVTDAIAGKTARRLFLSGAEDTLLLCFIDSDTGKIYSSSLSPTFSSLREKISQFPLGNAEFAFQLEEYEALDPYFIFSHEAAQLRAASAANPLRDVDLSDSILRQFGMNPATASQYPEADGSAVYVDGEKSLRIGVSGRIIFSAQENALRLPSKGPPPSVNELVSFCHGIVQNTLAQYAGEGTPVLSGLERSGSAVTVSFLYYLNGVPVMLPNGEAAASFHIVDSSLVRAEIYFRSYSFSDGILSAMPEIQAAAIAKEEGGEPVLVYQDNLDAVDCGWIRFEH